MLMVCIVVGAAENDNDDDDDDDDVEDKQNEGTSKPPRKKAKQEHDAEEVAEEVEGLSGDEVDESNIIKGGRAARRGRPNHLANATRSAQNTPAAPAPAPKKPGEDSDED